MSDDGQGNGSSVIGSVTRLTYTVDEVAYLLCASRAGSPTSTSARGSSRLTFADVQGWVSKLVRNGAAPRSVAKVCGVFRQIRGWAVQDGRLARNPAEGVPIPRPGLTHHRYLDHTHVATLARECSEYAPLVRLLAYTGLRWGEAAAIRVREVDLTRRRINVVASVTEVSGHLVWGTPKTRPGERFPSPVSSRRNSRRDGDALLSPRGGVLRVRNFRRSVFDAAVQRVGPAGLHPHELRHTAASLAIASGVDVNVVQTMLGHKTATMTLDLYGHLRTGSMTSPTEWTPQHVPQKGEMES